jgi:hypothetical protein
MGRVRSDWGRKYGKPRGQRWRTFWRRFNEAEAAVEHIDVRYERMIAAVRALDERVSRPKRGRTR